MGKGQALDYQKDLQLLVSTVQSIQDFPWNKIAEQVHLDKWRLYHNWNETIMRQVQGAVSKNDQNLIRMYLKDMLLKNKDADLGKNFQYELKQQLSKEYHRSSFSIAFNNCKRQVQKELENATTIEARNRIKREVQQFFEKLEKTKQVAEPSEQNKTKEERTDTTTLKQQQVQMDFLQEPSNTTAELCKQLQSKIQSQQGQLSNQTAILINQLNQFQYKTERLL